MDVQLLQVAAKPGACYHILHKAAGGSWQLQAINLLAVDKQPPFCQAELSFCKRRLVQVQLQLLILQFYRGCIPPGSANGCEPVSASYPALSTRSNSDVMYRCRRQVPDGALALDHDGSWVLRVDAYNKHAIIRCNKADTMQNLCGVPELHTTLKHQVPCQNLLRPLPVKLQITQPQADHTLL
jgi:hypothetical protein